MALGNMLLLPLHHPPQLQKRSSASAAEKRRLGRQPDEELQTDLEFIVSLQAFGDSRTISTSRILGQ